MATTEPAVRAPERRTSRATPPVRRGSAARSLFAHDRRFGERFVAGADEAGRGCLAGPLVAAAVCLDLERLRGSARRALTDLDDSKALPPPIRARVARAILRHAAQVVVVSASCRTIDRDGLHRTNLRLLARALAGLDPRPAACLVDGFRLGPQAPPHQAIVDGDAKSASIAAASVIAKVTRDRLMSGPAASRHPGFGFDRHMGYSTPEHRAAVRAHGPSPLHRMSFRSIAYEDLPFDDGVEIWLEEPPAADDRAPAATAAALGAIEAVAAIADSATAMPDVGAGVRATARRGGARLGR